MFMGRTMLEMLQLTLEDWLLELLYPEATLLDLNLQVDVLF